MFSKKTTTTGRALPTIGGLGKGAGNRSSLYSSSTNSSASTSTNVSDGFDSESDISDADSPPPIPSRAPPPVPSIPGKNNSAKSFTPSSSSSTTDATVPSSKPSSGQRRTSKRASSAPTHKSSRSPPGTSKSSTQPQLTDLAPTPPAPPPVPKAPGKKSNGHRRAKSYCGEGFRLMEGSTSSSSSTTEGAAGITGSSSSSDDAAQTKALVASLSTWLAARRGDFSSPPPPSSSSSSSSPSSSTSGTTMTPAQVEEFVSHLATHIGLTDQELVLMRIYLAKYTSKFTKAKPPPLPFGIQILCAAYLSQVLSYDDPLAKELWIVYSRCTWESFITKVMDFSTVLDFSLAVPADEFNYMYARMLDLHDEPRPETWSTISPSPTSRASSKAKPPPPPIVPSNTPRSLASAIASGSRTPRRTGSAGSRSGTAPPPRRRSDESASSSDDPPAVAPAPKYRASSANPGASRSGSSGHGRKHSLFSAFQTGQYKGPTGTGKKSS